MTRTPRVGLDRLAGWPDAAKIKSKARQSRRSIRRSAEIGALILCLAVLLGGVSSASAATTSPMLSATYDSSNNTQDVYYEAPNGSLQEVVWGPSGGFSQPRTWPGAGPLASAPAAAYDSSNNTQDVYYEAPNGSLQEVVWSPSSGFGRPLTILGAGSLALPPTTNAQGTTPPPGNTTPGTTTLTSPAHHHPERRALRVKVVLHWRWGGRLTWLTGVAFGHLPRRARFEIFCRGRGCPRRAVSAPAPRFSHRLEALPGPVYRAGDRLVIELSAPNHTPERAEVRIRKGRIPVARLLS